MTANYTGIEREKKKKETKWQTSIRPFCLHTLKGKWPCHQPYRQSCCQLNLFSVTVSQIKLHTTYFFLQWRKQRGHTRQRGTSFFSGEGETRQSHLREVGRSFSTSRPTTTIRCSSIIILVAWLVGEGQSEFWSTCGGRILTLTKFWHSFPTQFGCSTLN